MKVSLNIKPVEGPYGGGMKFARSLKEFLENKGWIVVNNLEDKDIDIILHIAPFPYQAISSYSFISAYLYKMRHPETIIVERINECDERKNTHFMNKLLVETSRYSDYIIYIASWLKPLMLNAGLSKNIPDTIILNGADKSIYNTSYKKNWDGKSPLKIATHHFGANMMKGHDIYMLLDKFLEDKEFAKLFEFTFIGNLPKNVSYKNTRLVGAIDGEILSKELQAHDIYITASRNEPAGMHHIEAALCGLPLLYIHSGALPEYCHGYGLEFNQENLKDKLLEMRNDYFLYREKLNDYPLTSTYMNERYHETFLDLLKTKDSYKENFSFKKRLLLKLYLIVYNIFLRPILLVKIHVL